MIILLGVLNAKVHRCPCPLLIALDVIKYRMVVLIVPAPARGGQARARNCHSRRQAAAQP